MYPRDLKLNAEIPSQKMTLTSEFMQIGIDCEFVRNSIMSVNS